MTNHTTRRAYREQLPFLPQPVNGCFWKVQPTGDYAADYETGRQYAMTFWKVCASRPNLGLDLSSILLSMIDEARPAEGYIWKRPRAEAFPRRRSSGIETGFLRMIGELLDLAMQVPALVKAGPKQIKAGTARIDRKTVRATGHLVGMLATAWHDQKKRLAAH
jgi:hypothetical protein